MRRALLLALLLCAGAAAAAVEDSAAAIERIKAAFLYKFAAYVEWPPASFPQPGSPFIIGVAGADAIADELERVSAGRNVGGRPVQVRRLARAQDAGSCCHILFIGSRNESTHVHELLGNARGHPVLTVTDSSAGHPPGSIINFLAASDRVRFDISRVAAERNGLQLRSQLLAVAHQVSQ